MTHRPAPGTHIGGTAPVLEPDRWGPTRRTAIVGAAIGGIVGAVAMVAASAPLWGVAVGAAAGTAAGLSVASFTATWHRQRHHLYIHRIVVDFHLERIDRLDAIAMIASTATFSAPATLVRGAGIDVTDIERVALERPGTDINDITFRLRVAHSELLAALGELRGDEASAAIAREQRYDTAHRLLASCIDDTLAAAACTLCRRRHLDVAATVAEIRRTATRLSTRRDPDSAAAAFVALAEDWDGTAGDLCDTVDDLWALDANGGPGTTEV